MFDSHLSSPRVSTNVFLGHHWGVAAVALCLITFRIGVRIRYFHRIWADDVLIIVAWFTLCATAILYQTQSVNLHNHYLLVTKKIPPTPIILAGERIFLKVFVAELFLWYATLWTVKLSILLFFRRLFGEHQFAPWLRVWWWFVTVFTVSSWAACLGTLSYSCLLNPQIWILGHCELPYAWTNMQLSRATDIITEVMILTIPVIGLWKVQISLKKKLALVGILCLTVITILFAIVRITMMPKQNSNTDVTWMCLWAHIEAGASFIVACLASFRQLYVKSNQSRPHKKIPDPEHYSNPRSSRIKNFSTRILRPSAKEPSGIRSLMLPLQTRPHAAESLYSHEDPGQWGTIYVGPEFGANTKVYVGEIEDVAQGDTHPPYPATARCNTETRTERGARNESQGRICVKTGIDGTVFQV